MALVNLLACPDSEVMSHRVDSILKWCQADLTLSCPSTVLSVVWHCLRSHDWTRPRSDATVATDRKSVV